MLAHMVRFEEATLDLVLIQHILLIMQFKMLPALQHIVEALLLTYGKIFMS